MTAISGRPWTHTLTGMPSFAWATCSLATAKTASRSELREISTIFWPAETTWPGSAAVDVTTPSSGARSSVAHVARLDAAGALRRERVVMRRDDDDTRRPCSGGRSCLFFGTASETDAGDASAEERL